MNFLSLQDSQGHYWLNGEVLKAKDVKMFANAESQASHTNQLGRGTAYLFAYAQLSLVMRHYRRGGMVRHLMRNQYLYLSLEQTRMWQELNLLAKMQQMQLPVPLPIAAHCIRTSPFTYTGSLVTKQIENSQTLAEYLLEAELPAEQWQQLGVTLAQFHNHCIYHADLNANNIMINNSGAFYLIDFDKGKLLSKTGSWVEETLSRLHRSLQKIQKRQSNNLHFSQENWQQLLNGHKSQFH